MTETAGIAVSVAPSQSAYFAGEDLSVIITFTNLNQPSTSYAHQFRQPRTATATAFAATHRRSSHSVAFPADTLHTARTASPFVNVAAVSLDSPLAHREAGSLTPRRRGFVGKGKEREDSDDSDPHMHSLAQISPISQFKRKHHPKSLSVSSPAGDGTNTRLPKLDTGQPVSPLIDQKKRHDASQLTPTRSSSKAIPKSHPHARKQSVFEGQSLVEEVPVTPLHSSTTPYTVTLDPINESATPIPYASPMGPPTPAPEVPGTISRNNAPEFREDIFSPYPTPAPQANGYRGAHSRRRSSLGQPALFNHSDNAPMRSLSMSPTSMGPRSTLYQAFAPPGTEVILWAYAKLVGTFEVSEAIVPPAEIDSLRAKLRAGGLLGGGRMDIAEHAPAASGTPGGLTSGLFSSFFGSHPPTTLPQQPSSSGYLSSFFRNGPSAPKHSRSLNINGRYGGGAGPSSGLFDGPMGAGQDVVSLPTLETQLSMLAVDLSLGPGETRSFRYTMPLPPVLPPTFRGNALKFTYTLVIGTSRTSSLSNLSSASLPLQQSPSNGSLSGTGNSYGGNPRSRSRVLRVPIRMYNHVSADEKLFFSVARPPVGFPSQPYDLLWPVGRRREIQRVGKGTAGQVEEIEAGGDDIITNGSPRKLLPPPRGRTATTAGGRATTDTKTSETLSVNKVSPSAADQLSTMRTTAAFRDLREYGGSLLPHDTSRDKAGAGMFSARPPPLDFDDSGASLRDDQLDRDQDDGFEGQDAHRDDVMKCREAVEVLTRNPKRMSYDIEKDGAKVAVLTFVKSAYRLGETILGVVDINFPGGRTKVLKVSATLEAHETLPPTIPLITSASSGAGRARTPNHMKRVHSEYLCAFAMNTRRASFSLDIPADGTPAFEITAYDPDEGAGGLAWHVRMNFLVAIAPPHSTESVMQGGDEETLRSHVQDGPGGEWGSSWRASDSLTPLVVPAVARNNVRPELWSGTMPTASGGARNWTSMFLGESEDNAEEGDGEVGDDDERRGVGVGGWVPVEVQTVECEVPVSIWPGATAFRPRESIFEC